MYNRDIFSKYSDKESTDEFDDDFVIDQFMEDQRAMGLTERECRMLYNKIAAAHIIEKKEFDKWKNFGTFWKLVI